MNRRSRSARESRICHHTRCGTRILGSNGPLDERLTGTGLVVPSRAARLDPGWCSKWPIDVSRSTRGSTESSTYSMPARSAGPANAVWVPRPLGGRGSSGVACFDLGLMVMAPPVRPRLPIAVLAATVLHRRARRSCPRDRCRSPTRLAYGSNSGIGAADHSGSRAATSSSRPAGACGRRGCDEGTASPGTRIARRGRTSRRRRS